MIDRSHQKGIDVTQRQPDETEADFKARRCIRLAAAFRERAIFLDAGGRPSVAQAMRDQARTAERAAGLILFRAMEPHTSPH